MLYSNYKNLWSICSVLTLGQRWTDGTGHVGITQGCKDAIRSPGNPNPPFGTLCLVIHISLVTSWFSNDIPFAAGRLARWAPWQHLIVKHLRPDCIVSRASFVFTLGLIRAALYQGVHLASLPSMPRLSSLDKACAVRQVEAGVSHKQVEALFEGEHNTITKLMTKFNETGGVKDKPQSRCPKRMGRPS